MSALLDFLINVLICRPVFSRLAAGLLAGASLAALAVPAEAGTSRTVRWNTGGAVWTTTSSEFKTFFSTGDITDRALSSGISNSGWTAEEIQEGMTKTYAVDIIGVSRFQMTPTTGEVKFLQDQDSVLVPEGPDPFLLPLLEDEVHLCGGSAFRDHRRLHRR